MRPIELEAETRDVLAFIGRTEFPLSVYGRSAGRVWPMVRGQVSKRISSFGVPVHEVNMYKRYVTELLNKQTDPKERSRAILQIRRIRTRVDFSCPVMQMRPEGPATANS